MAKAKKEPKLRLKGIVPAIFTPYDRRGEISYPVLGRIVDYLVGAGVHGFYVCGTTGEGILLSREERMTVLEHVLSRVPAKFPVIAQVGALSTREACVLARHAAEVGATAVSSLPPMGMIFKPSDIPIHYSAIAEAADLPFYAYHVPALGGHAASAAEIYELLKDVTNMVGIKVYHINGAYISELNEAAAGSWKIMYGHDDILLEALSIGADGMIGSTYNFVAERSLAIWNASIEQYLAGDQASQ